MPLHQIEGCYGIFHGGVTDVGSTRLNGPSKVLFDPKKKNMPHEDGSILEEKMRTGLAVPV